MLCQVIHWIRVDPSTLGVVKLAGTPVAQELGHPMMLLNVLTEFCGSDQILRMKYSEDFDWAVAAILKHVRNVTYVRTYVRVLSRGYWGLCQYNYHEITEHSVSNHDRVLS